MRSHLTLAAVVLTASHASAQMATYCDKTLAADLVYSVVSSNGKSSRIDFFLHLRNLSSKTVLANIYFNLYRPPSVISDRLRKLETLPQYKSVTLKLGTQTVDNPGGQGASSRDDALRSIVVVCPAAR